MQFSSCFSDRTPPPPSPTAPPAAADNTGAYLAKEFENVRSRQSIADLLVDGGLVEGIWYWDLEDRAYCFLSDDFWRALGFHPTGRTHRTQEWLDRIFEEDRATLEANLDAHLADPSVPFDRTLRMRTASGGTMLMRCRGIAIRENGVPVRMLGSHTVVNDLRREELSDRLSEVLSLSNDAVVVWSQCCGVKRWNRGAELLYGIPKPAILDRSHFDALSPEFPLPWKEIERRVGDGQAWKGEVEWTRPDGRRIVTETQFQRLSMSCGMAMLLQVDHDITAKVELSRQQRTMTRELNHRVKNLFAVIRSLVRFTAKGQEDVPSVVRALDKRIAALAAAHIVSLGHASADGGPLAEVLQAVLLPYPADPLALGLKGPAVTLTQDMITPMGLILNELATNALKHGAWSVPDGLVDVTWSVFEAEGALLLTLIWKERMPEFLPPDDTYKGFGTDLIQISVRQLGASLHRRWGKEGLILSLTVEIKPSQIAERPTPPSAIGRPALQEATRA